MAFKQVTPTLSDVPYSPYDTVIDAFDSAEIQLRAASTRGLLHRNHSAPRQDAFKVNQATLEDNTFVVIAVADGVGSRELSHLAASWAVDFAVASICKAPLDYMSNESAIWSELFERISNYIMEEAQSRALGSDAQSVRKFMATTLVCAVVTEKMIGGIRPAVVATVGDSGAWTLNGTSWLSITATKSTESDMTSTKTAALPVQTRPVPTVVSFDLTQEDTFFVMTDGVGDPLGSGTNTVGTNLAQWWSEAPNPLDFAAQCGFGRKSFMDDRTVVGVWNHGSMSEHPMNSAVN
ncbi:protein phosphatase 2C domain-containing protein [Glutamicibacter ardleyensis]|uniref:protein phosphatase 2C domain-containing protein n=1 Tax=Glutamicibacter ardleyensis TaxID=225894 RepID=UPI003FD32FAB